MNSQLGAGFDPAVAPRGRVHDVPRALTKSNVSKLHFNEIRKRPTAQCLPLLPLLRGWLSLRKAGAHGDAPERAATLRQLKTS